MSGQTAVALPLLGWGRRLLGRAPTSHDVSLGARYLGLAVLCLAVGASSLTFSWVIEHRADSNIFPEFAGRVVYLSDVLMAVGMGLWMLGRYLLPRRSLRLGPWFVLVPLLLLVSLSNISSAWAIDAAQARYAGLRWLSLLALYVVMANESRRAVLPMTAALFGVGLMHAVVAMAQTVGHSSVGLSQLGELAEGAWGYLAIGSPRSYGLGFNPNPVGLFLAVVGMLAYGLFVTRPGGWQRGGLTLGVFAVVLLGLLATLSVSALAGWLVGVAVVGVLAILGGTGDRAAPLKRVGLAAVLAVLVGVSSLLFVSARGGEPPLAGFGYVLSEGLHGRAVDFRLYTPAVQHRVLLGVGAGNYPLAVRDRFDRRTTPGLYTPVHSVPLVVFAELGALGGLAWMALMAAPVVWLISARGAAGHDLHGVLWLGPLLAVLVVSLVDFPPWATQDGRVLLVALLGLWSGSVGGAARG